MSPNGLEDLGFNPGIDTSNILRGGGPGNGANTTIALGNDIVVAVQPDGKILFKYFDLTSKYRLVRLNVDGSADTGFQIGSATPGTPPYTGLTAPYNLGAGSEQANEISAGSNAINGAVIQSDGRILLYGDLTQYNGQSVPGLLRLNADGSVDTSFNVGTGARGGSRGIDDLKVESNGKLLVVGDFTTFNGASFSGIAQLNADGSVDTSFSAGGITYQQTTIGSYGEGAGNSQLVAKPDGSYLLTGNYVTSAGSASGTILHVNVSGGLAQFFNGSVSLGGGYYYLAFPQNGNIFGYFTPYAYPFIYHVDLGFEYVLDAKDGVGGVYFYDFTSQHFFYTSPVFPFPYLYDFNLQTFLYYFPNTNSPTHYTTGPRYFVRLDTGVIFEQ